MNYVAFVLFVAVLDSARSKQCPMEYQRFSSRHTYCLTSTCQVKSGGSVSDADKKLILEIHNKLRSKLATGGETQYQTLPSAANMMQLEWDDELAAVAQAHANQCKFDHDENEQREVVNFSVGQNLLEAETLDIDWSQVASWYTKEVQFFNPSYIDPFLFSKSFGHFTQVTWATTWKIGCGVSGYVDNSGKNKALYTCNYGPGGNMPQGQAYKAGTACSACPKNTQCSSEYPGLCKSLTPNGPQLSIPTSSDYLLYCHFGNDDPQACKNVKITGTPLTSSTMYTGKYMTGVFNPGDKVTINFGKFQHPNGLCAFLIGRFGPNKAGGQAGSYVKFHFEAPGLIFPEDMKESRIIASWHTIGILMQSDSQMEVSYIFEVKQGAPPQYFEFKEFGVRGGQCP